MKRIEIKIERTNQNGIPAVTAMWSETMEGTFNLQGKYISGDFIPNFLDRGSYELSDNDKDLITSAIRRVGKTESAESLFFFKKEKETEKIPQSKSLCSKCRSYCFGDCQSF